MVDTWQCIVWCSSPPFIGSIPSSNHHIRVMWVHRGELTTICVGTLALVERLGAIILEMFGCCVAVRLTVIKLEGWAMSFVSVEIQIIEKIDIFDCGCLIIKGILWDRRWRVPSIRIFSHTCWFVYRNAFLIMKLSKLPSFRMIPALIDSQSIEK